MNSQPGPCDDSSTMRAFEIHLNGKKLCVAGLEGGTLNFFVGCSENRQGRGGVGLNMTGILPTLATVRWLHRGLRMNDEVCLKVVESAKSDRYKIMQEAPADERKYKKAYVRRMAKEFGWSIQTGTKRRKTAGART